MKKNIKIDFKHINAYDDNGRVFIVIETETNEALFINKKLLDYIFEHDVKKLKNGSKKSTE
jgi:hypothetical protein